MQVLPVIPKATVQEMINGCLVKSYLYRQLHQLRVTENMRERTDLKFSDFFLRIGTGTELTDINGNVILPEEMVIRYDDGNEEGSQDKLIDNIFPDLENNYLSASYMLRRAILASKNQYVDQLNERIINKFPDEAKVYSSFDVAVDDSHNFYLEEFLNSLTPNGLPPDRLVLKENCSVMLMRNLYPSDGLCNGTRMICRAFEKNVIHVEISAGHHSGKHVLIPQIPLSPAENEGILFQFRRKQFSLRLCFAMTINKAQGQTIPLVGVNLLELVFSHGQLYVALSRGISMADTKVMVRQESKDVVGNMRAKNIVYKEVLENIV